ncbi:AMP-binding protein [Nocardioides pacificus]
MSSDQPLTLPAALRRAAQSFGGRTAVVDAGARTSYGELLELVRSAASGYAALGVRPGDRVVVWAPNGREWVVAALAVSYAGATLVPANTRYTGHEVVELAERTRASLLVLSDGFLGREQLREIVRAADALPAAHRAHADDDVVPGLPYLRAVVRIGDGPAPAHITPYDALAGLGADLLATVDERAAAVSPDDIADILFTSGTTGRSKGVLTAHRQTIAAARVWGETVGVGEGDSYLLVNPFFHSFGYKAGILVCLLNGATMHPQATFDVAESIRLIEEERISVLAGAPTIFHSIGTTPGISRRDLSSLRVAVTGAATVPVAVIEMMQRELAIETVVTAFGMTECVVATMCRPGDPADLVAASCGLPVDGLELRIVSPETGSPLEAGEEGEVQLRGPMVMQGYLDDLEATAEAIDADGWLHTGDVGKVDERGYLAITDRLKDMYISGGFNVYPAEVEQALARVPGVLDAAVVGVADERMGEVGRAFVVRRPGSPVTAGQVLDGLRERLAKFKVPREVVFVDELPRNLSGKILKNELRSQS